MTNRLIAPLVVLLCSNFSSCDRNIGYDEGSRTEAVAPRESLGVISDISKYLSPYLDRELSDDEKNEIRNGLLFKSIVGPGGLRIEHEGKTTGFLGMFDTKDLAIFYFEKEVGPDRFQSQNVLVYSHYSENLFFREVWRDYDTNKSTVWGLYRYSRIVHLRAEGTYFPQDVIVVNNDSGAISLVSNVAKKYKMVNYL